MQISLPSHSTFISHHCKHSLEADALAFAKEIDLDCKNRVPTNNINDYGVNSAVKANQRNFRSPQALLQMWENQLPKGYPKNKVMTQVL